MPQTLTTLKVSLLEENVYFYLLKSHSCLHFWHKYFYRQRFELNVQYVGSAQQSTERKHKRKFNFITHLRIKTATIMALHDVIENLNSLQPCFYYSLFRNHLLFMITFYLYDTSIR